MVGGLTVSSSELLTKLNKSGLFLFLLFFSFCAEWPLLPQCLALRQNHIFTHSLTHSSIGNSHHPGFVLSPLHQGESSGGGDSGSLSQGGGGACIPLSGILQSHVRSVRRVEAHYRSLYSQPFSCDFEVSNGDCPVGPPVGSEERLDGYYRSQGRLPPDSDSSVESEVSEVYGRRESLAVQGSLLRPIHGTAGIYPGYDLGIRFSTSSGCQDVAIPGRLADHGFLSRRGLPGKGHGTPTLSRVGDHCKFGKIKLDSISIDCVSGDQDRVADFQGFADSLEDRKVLLNSRRISVIKGAVCEVLESTARSPRVVDAPSSRWSTPDEGFTVSSQKELGRLGLGSLGRPLPRGSSMVVRRGSS